jgi:uncharacterized protein with von Willebrand factor type A (vWA) domain
MSAPGQPFRVRTLGLDLPAVAGAFNRRLHDAGVPVSAERAAWFARALATVQPVSRRRLYWTARGVFVSDPSHVRAFDAVFASVFGSAPLQAEAPPEAETTPAEPAPADEPRRTVDGAALGGAKAPGAPGRHSTEVVAQDVPVPVLASDEEVLRARRFDALEPDELARLYGLMTRMRIATPLRRTRRAERDRHGERVDLRRTLRGSLRTAGDPVRLAHRSRRVVRRRLVLLCDISGSMEPYARAYLQFLTAAAGGAGTNRAETFVFATRLTRLTRALRSRNPERAIQRAASTAPDWSSGTRIGDALKTFNDRHGRRGMARGAVVVILSDGWERGDPSLVAREMQRLRRLAHRIVWVNPRVSAQGFEARAGGLVAALPFCDALVSGHSLDALAEVVDAIGASRREEHGAPLGLPLDAGPEPEQEPWPSATPVPGSSVAMPSGYGPSRGRTTPGWSIG